MGYSCSSVKQPRPFFTDFHLFGPLKEYQRRQKFKDDEAIKVAVQS